MRKVFALVLLGIGASVVALADPVGAPEIDPGTGISAISLLTGALLVIRSRCKK